LESSRFAAREDGPLGWLNWEDSKTREDVSAFFAEDAPLFQELIVDDFFCTGDTSASSQRARGQRSWGEYRRDLLVSSIEPLMRGPSRRANPGASLIVKFPQWYDRFQLFGYDPPRMAAAFDQVWVGTEVRNPKTRRMGFVQPTEGYVNFRWLTAVAGEKVVGAWFDHIECTPRNFVDQAFQSVLAGARELTLFHLGDVMERHPGDALLAEQMTELTNLAARVRGRGRQGIPFYKPAASDAGDNLYLMDYLTMIGVPVLPVASYPDEAPVAFLGVQAAADPDLAGKIQRHIHRRGTVILTPALVRKLGVKGEELAGVQVPASVRAALADEAFGGHLPGDGSKLPAPIEVDAALTVTRAHLVLGAKSGGRSVPLLTNHALDRGRVVVLNIRTFSEQDFRDAGEWLLAPKARGWTEIPQVLADDVREPILAGLELRVAAPAGVGVYLFDGAFSLYNFHDDPVTVRWQGRPIRLGPNQCLWEVDQRPASQTYGPTL
jgi:hypothetical protein